MKKITSLSVLLNLGLIILLLLINYKNKVLQEKIFLLEKEKNNRKEIVRRNDINELDKNDPVFIFNSKKFPCDFKYGSYEINLCLGEKLHFADSLLNAVVKSDLEDFDLEIKKYKEGVLKAKDNTFFVNSLKMNIASKENFIKYQKKWQELRVLNSEHIQIGCDGGTGCSAIVSGEEIKFILKRIQEIKRIN